MYVIYTKNTVGGPSGDFHVIVGSGSAHHMKCLSFVQNHSTKSDESIKRKAPKHREDD